MTTLAAPPATPLPNTPQADFHSPRYLRNNFRRMEHLASLGLPIAGRTVLEVGAGIGDLTTHFLDRGCTVVSTEGRPANFDILRARYADDPAVETHPLDLDPPPAALPFGDRTFDAVFCYGLLYHLSDPAAALDTLAAACRGMLLLETIVSFGDHEAVNPWTEDAALAGAAVTGRGCRPTRPWIWRALRDRFDHVYTTRAQPHHDEFPTDWTAGGHPCAARSIFVASRAPLDLPTLSDTLLTKQSRH